MNIILISMFSFLNLFAADPKCSPVYFDQINETLSVEKTGPSNYRICEDKVLKRGSLKFYLETNGRLYIYSGEIVWFYDQVVESELDGVAVYHFSSRSLLSKNRSHVHLDKDSMPFVYRINNQSFNCDRVVKDEPRDRINGNFDIEGNFLGCFINPTPIKFMNQSIIIDDEIRFSKNGNIELIYLTSGSTLFFPLHGSNKTLPLIDGISFTPGGQIKRGRTGPVTFLFKDETYAATMEISGCDVSACGPYDWGSFYMQGSSPAIGPGNHRYLIEESDVYDYYKIYRNFCKASNPRLDQFSFYSTNTIYSQEVVEDETFYDIKTGVLVRKQQEQVNIPNLTCRYRHDVAYEKLPEFLK